MAKGILGARIGGIHLIVLALGIVGEHDINAAIDRVRLHVLGAVHLGRAEKITGTPGFDQHIGLTFEAVLLGQRTLTEYQRHPLDLAIFMEFGHVKRAFIQQVHIGSAIIRVELARRHELVDIVEAFVVAQIEDHAPVLVDDGFGTLMLETAKRGPLLRHGVRIGHIDLDDPAKAVRFVRLLGNIETVVETSPFV